MKEHCDIVISVINDVLKQFKIIEEYNVCVFIIGSFARCTNKKNSDIDLQFSYDEEYKEQIFKYEELIYYIISQVLDLKRTSVHSMLVSRMNRENINYLETILDDTPLNVTINSPNGQISYQYSANTKRRIYLQYGNDNNLDNVFKYLKNEIDGSNKEWVHTFYVFTEKEKFSSLYNKLFDYEKKNINIHKIVNRIERIKNKIFEINNYLIDLDRNNISQVKMIYQKKEFALLNEYISYKRDLAIYNGINWQYINYYDNSNYLKDDNIFQMILLYMFKIFDIAEPLGKKYSLHSNERVILNNYEELENSLKEINTKILNKLLKEEKWKD